MSNSIKINASANTVDSVCVYQADRAEVKRAFTVTLAAGNNEVYIERLPVKVDKDSIRVEGFGNAVINDVVYHPPSTKRGRDKPKDPTMQALQKEVNDLSAKESILTDQVNILDAYSKTFKAEVADPKALSTYFDTYQAVSAELYTELGEIRLKLQDAVKEAADYTKKIAADEKSEKKLGVKVAVAVYALEAGDVELTLTYVVSGASWSPQYDLHTKVEDSKDGASAATLFYQASIKQNTGEDWNDVALTLSTAAPQTGSSIPALPTYRIGKPLPPPPMAPMPFIPPSHYPRHHHHVIDPPPFVPPSFATGQQPYSPQPTGQLQLLTGQPPMMYRSAMLEPQGFVPPAGEPAYAFASFGHREATDFLVDDNGPMVANTATIAGGATSSSFVINGKSTIQTNRKDKDRTHKVSIAVLQLEGQLEWITIPKIRPVAFLRCQIKNASEYILLSGPSSIFMDGGFVCKSYLSTVSSQETFTVSLGVDPAVRITYHDLQKKTKSSLGTIISGKSDVTSFSQTISVKNARSNAVSPLYIKDQVPTSEDVEFKIEIKEPKNLGVAKERKEVSIASGVKAHWAFKDSPGSEGTVEDDGVVEWICSIPSGKGVDLPLNWDVVAPVGKLWMHK